MDDSFDPLRIALTGTLDVYTIIIIIIIVLQYCLVETFKEGRREVIL